jgi:hypothetical protein
MSGWSNWPLPPEPCRWIRDDEVPGGWFLVPGCWNRVVGGDEADCHCDHLTDTREGETR